MINTQSMQKMADILRKIRNPSLTEDTDKSEPGTQGDKEAYEKKRDAVLKKFGVKSCASCETEEEKKACFKALDDAHVADHEEQVQTEANKIECPKCEGEGCKHCDGKGYHLEDEDADPVGKNEEVKVDEAKKPTRDTGMECMECGKKFRAKLSTLQYGKTKCPKCKSTDIDFAFGESVKEEVEIEEGGLYAAKEPAYPPTIDNLKKIVKDKQNLMFMFKDGRARVDLFSASAMTQVYDALKKPDHKKHFEKMIGTKAGFLQAQGFAMKMTGKGI